MIAILHILQHAIGRDEYGRSERGHEARDCRNHYCIGEGGTGFDVCRAAVAAGLMSEHAPRAISGGDHIFVVTEAGKAYVAAHSPKPPKVSRSKARYQSWLGSAAADVGVSFGEWLKEGQYRTSGDGATRGNDVSEWFRSEWT